MNATELARASVSELIAAGVREVVLAPGSRNAPLAFALADAADAGLLRLHTRIDERTAAFLALGLTKAGRRAAVACTSGTAVANLHPAVLEAAHVGLPLVVVTADRPARLRGTGASQTTDHVAIFREHAVFVDADEVSGVGEVRAALARSDRPVHLNVQFDGVLVPDDRWSPSVEPPAEPARFVPPPEDPEGSLVVPLGPATVVVAGDDAGPPARRIAERGNWPLLAEPTSGARTGAHAIRTYRLLLGTDLGAAVQRVIVVGHPTLSRPVTRLLERHDVEVISVAPRGVWAERPFAVATHATGIDPAGADDDAWIDRWRAADRDLGRRIDALVASEPDLTPYEVARAVGRAVVPGALLWVGASSPIRDLDLMLAPFGVGQRRRIIANRGLAGIDGTLSSAIGAALGRKHSTRALALMGDVTFVHDLTGLVMGPDEERPDLTIVVVNDDGGSIFSMLEQGAEAYADRFERLFATPHGVDLASACAAARVPYLRVDSLPELEQVLSSPNGGVEVVEARVRRDNRRDLDLRIRELAEG